MELYDEVVKGCEQRQRRHPSPPRSRITGMRATTLGELLFIDHVDLTYEKKRYAVLVVVDAMSNFVQVHSKTRRRNRRSRPFCVARMNF
eukprot:10479052-Prorocentrum_lima.AAC.1